MAAYGDTLHEHLSEAFSTNPHGKPYQNCVSEHLGQTAFWILDEQVSSNKQEDAYEVRVSEGKKVRRICVDGGLIKDQRGQSSPKCDDILFDGNSFLYVEAKMRVGRDSKSILREINDALENKIPQTHQKLRSRLVDFGHELSVGDIGIVITMRQRAIPRIDAQRDEKLLRQAKKSVGGFVKRVKLAESIRF